MDDTISRQAVIDAVQNRHMMLSKEKVLLINDLEKLPSAELHWIPVTERLPDNSRNVLITSKGGVSTAWYNGSYFEKGASTHHRKMKTVTAWRELPEPYKGIK